VNYYQRRGGNSSFELYLHGSSSNGTNFSPFFDEGIQCHFGAGLSFLLKGFELPNVLPTANVTQVNINTLGGRYASNVEWSDDPLDPAATLHDAALTASNVEHLGMPWYVRGGTDPSFPADYNVMKMLADV